MVIARHIVKPVWAGLAIKFWMLGNRTGKMRGLLWLQA